MHPVRKKRLIIVLLIVAGVSLEAYLIFVALGENLNHFYTPSQIAAGDMKPGQKIRVGGLVVEGSVSREKGDGLVVSFELTDNKEGVVEVQYQGILPDLFREGQGIVSTGTFSEDGVVIADEVLAKHDENYMPPEMMEAIKEAGHPGK